MVTKTKGKLYYSPSATLGGLECNHGFNKVLERREDLRRHGIEIVDTTAMSDHERQSEYIHAATASVLKKYRIRQVFGSRRIAGSNFGRGVPALVIQGALSGTVAEDVFPHVEAGRVVTISDFLTQLTGQR